MLALVRRRSAAVLGAALSGKADGVIRLRPDDDYMLAVHHPTTPAQIGALLTFESAGAPAEQFADAARCHLAGRLPLTPLLRLRRSAPAHIDCDAWFELADIDVDRVITVAGQDDEFSDDGLHDRTAQWAMEQLDPEGPPFHFIVVPRVAGGRSAVYLRTLHALADGVGFQSIVRDLTDGEGDAPPQGPRRGRDERIPGRVEWLVRSGLALLGDSWRARSTRAEQAHAREALAAFKADPAKKRARTPKLEMGGPNSTSRSFATLTVSLDRLQRLGTALQATVNDVFLLVGSGAVRGFLSEIGDLPDEPIVANAARSYRRPEHGEIGNRIISLHPHLATHLDDPLARLEAIQTSMAAEIERSRLQEATMDQSATFFSARKIRKLAASRVRDGGMMTPGNVTLSNVPGPAAPRFLAGYRMVGNYPTPIVGSGRFLNVTMRRYCDGLDMGIMTDAEKVADARLIRRHIESALEQLEQLVAAR